MVTNKNVNNNEQMLEFIKYHTIIECLHGKVALLQLIIVYQLYFAGQYKHKYVVFIEKNG